MSSTLNFLSETAVKCELLHANHISYISKSLRKAILSPKSIFQKMHILLFKKNKKQKNYFSRLYKEEWKYFLNKLNTSFVSGNKLFWKIVKPFFSYKSRHQDNKKLFQSNKLLQGDNEIAEELNNVFKEAVSFLDISENSHIINPHFINISDYIQKHISKYKFHPSILLIHNMFVPNADFLCQKTLWFSDIFCAIEKRCIGNEWVNDNTVN